MITARNHFERDAAAHRGDHRCQLGRCAERVELPLGNQHRHCDVTEVRRSELVGLSGRMERIAEREHTIQRVALCGKVRRDAAAHRLAAREQRARLANGSSGDIDHTAEGAFQNRGLIGRASTSFHVRKVERPDIDAHFCEPTRDADDEWMALAGAGAVREDDAQIGSRLRCGGIPHCRGVSSAFDGNRQARAYNRDISTHLGPTLVR